MASLTDDRLERACGRCSLPNSRARWALFFWLYKFQNLEKDTTMALNGLHVTAGYAGSFRRDKSQPILGKIIWSEAPGSGAATTNVAPALSDVFAEPGDKVAWSAA